MIIGDYMELRQLKAFVTVAKLQSFTKAAEKLDYAQSSITAQIHTLETELGVKLFERLGRQVCLTVNGTCLLDYAEKILQLTTEATERVSGENIPSGELIIGAAETLCVFRLPKLLQENREKYPNVRIKVKLGSCEEFPDWLRKNEIDIAFALTQGIDEPDLAVKTLLYEPMVVVGSSKHRLIEPKGIYPDSLRGECIIMTEKGCGYRSVFENMLATAGVTYSDLLEFGSVEAIKQCVMSGIGIATLPLVAVKQELDKGSLVDLNWKGPIFDIKTQLFYHKDKWLTPALKAFIEMAEKKWLLN